MKRYLLLLATLTSLSGAAQEVERVDPPFWWDDMQSSQLQLLVYGKDIGDLDASVKHQDVVLEQVQRVANVNYLFLTLRLTDAFTGGQVLIQLQANGKTKVQFHYSFLTRRQGSAQRQGFDASDAIYLITPDRFANGNPDNDSIAGLKESANRDSAVGRHGGDIAGISEHMNYIADMGFTAIWPTPMLENDQADYSYHGYSITDHYRIDPRFGSNEDYRHLSIEGQKQGVGLIQDIVLNHIGSGHWWMADLPTSDWLNYQGDFQPTTHYRTSVQDPYAAKIDRQEFTQGWFVESMPDLNQRNPLVATYLIQNSIWWVEYADLYGIRTDTHSYSNKAFLTRWTERLMEEYPNLNIVGEEMSMNPNVVSYWQRGKDNHDGYVSSLPSVMDFPLYETLRTSLSEEEAWGQGLIRIYELLANDNLYPDPMKLMIFAENHDTSRLYSYLDESLKRFNIAMTVLATMRGIPQFFYASEVLATSPKERNDGLVRSDFPGGWPGDKRNGFTRVGLTESQLDAQEYLRTLLNWRQSTSVIHHGKLLHFAPHEGVYVYFRYDDHQTIMVAINHTESDKVINLERYQEGIGEYQSATDVITGEQQSLDKTMTLAPMRASVYELD